MSQTLVLYVALIGPLVPGELGPLRLPTQAWWFIPVATRLGTVYDLSPRLVRKAGLPRRPYRASRTLEALLLRRIGYEKLAGQGLKPVIASGRVALLRPWGEVIFWEEIPPASPKEGANWLNLPQKPLSLPPLEDIHLHRHGQSLSQLMQALA